MSFAFGKRNDNFSPKKINKTTLHQIYGWKTQAKVLEGKKPDAKGIVDAVPYKTPVLIEEFDMHKKIQAYADDTNLALLVKKAISTGDTSILNNHKGDYLDVTDIPTDRVDAVNKSRELSKKAGDVAAALGSSSSALLEMSKDELDVLIQQHVEKILGSQKPATETGKDGE